MGGFEFTELLYCLFVCVRSICRAIYSYYTKCCRVTSQFQAIKSKGVPRQAEVARGAPGRLRPRIFLTFRHYKGGRSSAKRTSRLYPRINPWYSHSKAESTSGHMVLSGVPRKKSPVTPPGIDSGTVRPVALRLNHYATPGSNFKPLPRVKLSVYTLIPPTIHILLYAFKIHVHNRFLVPESTNAQRRKLFTSFVQY